MGEVERRRKLSSARRAEYQRLLLDQDLASIEDLARRDLAWRAVLPLDASKRIVALALQNPSWNAPELLVTVRAENGDIELADVEATLAAHRLATFDDRLLRLQEAFAASSVDLTLEQTTLIEAANPCFAERRVESSRPGGLLAQDHFPAGEIAGVGEIYLEAVVDTFSSYAFARLRQGQSPEVGAAVLNDDVLPFFAARRLAVGAIVTRDNAAYNSPDHHPYRLYLTLSGAEHRLVVARNGFVEDFRRVVVGEFLGGPFASSLGASLDDLQGRLAGWLEYYNAWRPHPGYRNFEKSPREAIDEYVGQHGWMRWLTLPLARSRTLGVAFWWVAVVLALVAQRILTTQSNELVGAIPMGIAALTGLSGTLLIDRVWEVTSGRKPGVIRRAQRIWKLDRPTRPLLLLASGALAALALATFGVATQWPLVVTTVLWILGLGQAAAAAGVWGKTPVRLWSNPRQFRETLVVLALMALAFGARFYDVHGIPFDLHGDESAVGLEARNIVTGDVASLFALGWFAQPELSFAPSALSMIIFGDGLFGLRLASVVQGTLSVGLLYGVAKRLFSRRVAILSAFVLAVSQMAIQFSRDGNNYIGALFASLLLFYFLERGLERRRPIDFTLAGFAVGYCVSVYIAARLTPVVAVLYCLHRAFRERNFLREQWRGLTLVAVGAILFMTPQLVFYSQNSMRIMDRTRGVFLFNNENLAHEYDAYHVDTVVGVLYNQALRSIDAFNVRGDSSEQYGQQGPLLDDWSAALFALGLVLVTFGIRRSAYFLLASWFWLTLILGSVLSTDSLFSPHIVASLGVIAMIPCVVLDAGWRGMVARFGDLGKRAATAIVIVFAVLIAHANYVDYFQIHPKASRTSHFWGVLVRYILEVNDRYRVYFLAGSTDSLNYDTPRFVLPNVDGVDVRDQPLSLPLDRVPAQKGVVFIVRGPNPTDPRLVAIKATYPRGVEELQRSVTGYIESHSVRVEHADLLLAKPDAFVDNAPIHAVDITKLANP